MVSYGGGANSTALLIGLHQHRIPVDLILFADTGAEHPHTYAYLEVMDSWLKDHGMPPITRVYKTTRDGKRLTLEDECLDEATSSIDTHTEILVQKGIEALLSGRTSFVIAHRLSTIQNADRIFVIDQGGILEQGSPAELMKKKGAYYDLYMAQFAGLE